MALPLAVEFDSAARWHLLDPRLVHRIGVPDLLNGREYSDAADGEVVSAATGQGSPPSATTCRICGIEMNERTDCGGDCVWCLADAGDPECVKYAEAIPRPASDAANQQEFTISPEALQEALRIARGYAVLDAPGHINVLALALLAVVEGGRV